MRRAGGLGAAGCPHTAGDADLREDVALLLGLPARMHREAHRLSLRQFQPRWAQASDGPSIISHFESIVAWTGHVGVWDSLDIFPGCPSFSKESIVALLGPFFLSHMKRAIEFVHKVQDLYFVWFPADFSINGAAASNLQRSAILQVKKKI